MRSCCPSTRRVNVSPSAIPTTLPMCSDSDADGVFLAGPVPRGPRPRRKPPRAKQARGCVHPHLPAASGTMIGFLLSPGGGLEPIDEVVDLLAGGWERGECDTDTDRIDGPCTRVSGVISLDT